MLRVELLDERVVADGQHQLQHGATRCNTVPRGATRCHAVQHGATRCNTVPRGATQCHAVQHSATRCNTGLRGTTRCGAVQHCVTRCNTVSCSATRCGAVQHGATQSDVCSTCAYCCNTAALQPVATAHLDIRGLERHGRSIRLVHVLVVELLLGLCMVECVRVARVHACVRWAFGGGSRRDTNSTWIGAEREREQCALGL